jgi:sugar lactone lactonase YvrE
MSSVRVRRGLFAGGTAAAAALLTAVALTAAGTPASAATDLGLPDYGDLVVDAAHDQVFISGGPAANGIVVTDLRGRVEETIGNQYGATGLALSADGKKLYVAQAAGDAIAVIDTASRKQTARYPTGARTCPTHLVRTAELLWFSHGCDGTWSGGVGRVKFPPPATGPAPSASPSGSSSPTATPTASPSPAPPEITLHAQGSVRFQRAPLLAARDDAAGPLVAGQPNLSLSTVYVYAIDGNGALSTQASGSAPGSNLNDIALDRSGQTLFTAAGSRNATQAYATADLSGRGSYYTGYYPLAAAQSPDGYHIANGVRSTGDDVYVYEMGGVQPERRIDVGTEVVVPRGVTWSPDSDRLYIVTQPPAGGAPSLHVESLSILP